MQGGFPIKQPQDSRSLHFIIAKRLQIGSAKLPQWVAIHGGGTNTGPQFAELGHGQWFGIRITEAAAQEQDAQAVPEESSAETDRPVRAIPAFAAEGPDKPDAAADRVAVKS